MGKHWNLSPEALKNHHRFTEDERFDRTGKKMSEATKKKMSIASKGKKKSLEHAKNISKGLTGVKKPSVAGKNHYLWKEDRTKIMEKHRLRGTIEWKVWRGEVFERDKYTCKECGAKGVYLEPHHIISIEQDISKVFEIKNGITLCRPCHQKTIRKEPIFAEKYSLLVVA